MLTEKPADFLIINATIPDLNKSDPDFPEPAFLTISDGWIREVGVMTGPNPLPAARRTLDAAGGLVLPGLINGHTHAAMALFRGLADDLPLMAWLENHIFPAEARFVNPEMVYWCAKLAAAEMILNGTTCVADSYFHEEMAARAFRDAGLRAVAAQGIIDFPAPGVPDPAGNIAAAENFLAAWQGRDPLITPAVFCHSPYTCSPETIQRAKALSRRYQAPFFIHAAETEAETAIIRERFGTTPISHLDQLGVLDEQTVCVHCIWLPPRDLDLLARSGAAAVVCPASHLKLASGIAPLPALLERGIPVGLGTDGPASNNGLDLFRELDLAAKIPKSFFHDPTLIPARQALRSVNGEGARALGLEGLIGTVAPGRKADLLVLDWCRPHLAPAYDTASLLVYAARGADVSTVFIEGRLVMEDRRLCTMDAAEAMREVRRLARQVRTTI